MTCFLMRNRVKREINRLKINNLDKLNVLLLNYYSDEELHAMSEAEIIEAIRMVYKMHKKELTEDVKLIYV